MKKQMKSGTRHTMIAFLGIVTSIVIYGGIIGVSIFFYLLHRGYFPIPDIKDYLYTYLFCAGVSLLIIAPFLVLRKRFKHFSYGLLFSLLFIGVIVVGNTIDFYNYLTPEPFDEKQWKSKPDKSLDMVYYLMRNESILNDKTRPEVINLLGSDFIDEYSDERRLTYHIGASDISYFEITFDSTDRVEQFYYRYHD